MTSAVEKKLGVSPSVTACAVSPPSSEGGKTRKAIQSSQKKEIAAASFNQGAVRSCELEIEKDAERKKSEQWSERKAIRNSRKKKSLLHLLIKEQFAHANWK